MEPSSSTSADAAPNMRPEKRNMKEMSKAERRAYQEAQRAAKNNIGSTCAVVVTAPAIHVTPGSATGHAKKINISNATRNNMVASNTSSNSNAYHSSHSNSIPPPVSTSSFVKESRRDPRLDHDADRELDFNQHSHAQTSSVNNKIDPLCGQYCTSTFLAAICDFPPYGLTPPTIHARCLCCSNNAANSTSVSTSNTANNSTTTTTTTNTNNCNNGSFCSSSSSSSLSSSVYGTSSKFVASFTSGTFSSTQNSSHTNTNNFGYTGSDGVTHVLSSSAYGATPSLFAHLPGPLSRPVSSLVPDTPLHPVVFRLGLLVATSAICGANARSYAMLMAFRRLAEDFHVPPNTDFVREFMPYLSRHITFLSRVRQLSGPMGNAIRQLKKDFTSLPAKISASEARLHIIRYIDAYVLERVALAVRGLADHGITMIKVNDVIMTYSYSTSVCALLRQAAQLVKFRVVVVTARARNEGLRLARELRVIGISVMLVPISALALAMRDVTKVILGAQSMLSNGALVSRVGASQVAMMARHMNKPVIVACETYKFSLSAHLDSIVFNELGPCSELLRPDHSPFSQKIPGVLGTGRVKMLNLVYGVTPPEFITVVITELGLIPVSSTRVIIREYMPMIEAVN